MYGKMLYKKLYYTAITRSKKKLILIGNLEALRFASNNNLSDIRRTTIKDRIINAYNSEDMI
jgi:exodeoxyribonuclease V alpha subunit